MKTRPNVNYSQVQKRGNTIGKHMHAKGQEIPILHLRPKVFQKVPPKRVQNISFLKKSSTSCQEYWYLHPVPFHKIQESIMCLWFFPNAYFGLLYHTLYYTPSSACFVGVWDPYYHGSWSRNLHVFLHTRRIQNNNWIQNSCMKGLGPKSSVSRILAKPPIGHPFPFPLTGQRNRTFPCFRRNVGLWHIYVTTQKKELTMDPSSKEEKTQLPKS
jgi:hypothetical protein